MAALSVVLSLSLVAGASATKLTLRTGELVVHAEGGFAPTTLPRHENAPITLHGGGTIETSSGALPPILKTLAFKFDRHGAVDTTGLEVCRTSKLEATTTVAARRACPNAIVGEGSGKVIVTFPEQAPIRASTPLTVFNGPEKGRDPTLIVHAYLSVPVPTAYIVPVVIEKIHDGIYGYRVKATIPPIANGYGVPVAGKLRVGRKWTYKGRRHSYLSARCETGHLQARTEFTFDDGTDLIGTLVNPCKARP
jgi:hypothetical protein